MRLPIRVRRALSRPLDSIPVRVRAGPNKGCRWSLPVSGRGFASGRFELAKFEALAAIVSLGDVVWDVGAHYGYATLLTARLAGPEGSVWSFEPSRLNRSYLTRHVAWNCSGRANVLPYALAERDGKEAFGGSGSSMALGLGRGDEEVEVRSISGMLDAGVPPPTVMKVDAEGSESRIVESLVRTQVRPVVMCAIHDEKQLELCMEALHQADYEVLPSGPIRKFLNDDSVWGGDPDIVALPQNNPRLRDRLSRTDLFRDESAF